MQDTCFLPVLSFISIYIYAKLIELFGHVARTHAHIDIFKQTHDFFPHQFNIHDKIIILSIICYVLRLLGKKKLCKKV